MQNFIHIDTYMHKQIHRIKKLHPFSKAHKLTYIPCQWHGEMTNFYEFLPSFIFIFWRNAFYLSWSHSLHRSQTYGYLLITDDIFHDNPEATPTSFSWVHDIVFITQPWSTKLLYCWLWTFNDKDKLGGLNWSFLVDSTLSIYIFIFELGPLYGADSCIVLCGCGAQSGRFKTCP